MHIRFVRAGPSHLFCRAGLLEVGQQRSPLGLRIQGGHEGQAEESTYTSHAKDIMVRAGCMLPG